MEKITLKFIDLFDLNTELSGLTNPNTGEVIHNGILQEELSITTKYWLNRLADTVVSEIKSVEKVKEDLIKEYGTQDDKGGFFIPMRINESFDENGNLVDFEINPKFSKFQEELNNLMTEEITLEYRPFDVNEFNIKSKVNPRILFKLTKEPLT